MENLRIQWSILLPTSQGSCLIFNVIFADWNGGYWKIDSWLDGINLMADEIRGLLRFFLFSWRKMGISLWRRAGSDVCWSFDFFLLSVADREDCSARGESNGNNDSLQACWNGKRAASDGDWCSLLSSSSAHWMIDVSDVVCWTPPRR